MDESLDRDDNDDAVDAGWLVRPYLSIFRYPERKHARAGRRAELESLLNNGFSECNWSICRRSGVSALVGCFADSDQEEG